MQLSWYANSAQDVRLSWFIIDGKKPFPQAETLSLTCGAKQAHINSCFFLDDVNFSFTGKVLNFVHASNFIGDTFIFKEEKKKGSHNKG